MFWFALAFALFAVVAYKALREKNWMRLITVAAFTAFTLLLIIWGISLTTLIK